MSTRPDWRGVFPALTTEFHADGSLDLDATARHAELLVDAGCTGIVVLGTLGENTSLEPAEKERVIRAVVEAVGARVPVLAGIAEFTTAAAVESARRARAAGARGLMVLPCMVYVHDQREAEAHFAAVARSTDLPIMIYNNPVAYGTDVLPETLARHARFENIVAVKDSAHDSRRMTDTRNAVGDRFLLFCGVDDFLLENVVCGAVGWVAGAANALPRESVLLFEAAARRDLDRALALYRWLMPLLHLDTHRKLVQCIKLADQLCGTGREHVRPPRLPLEGAERRMVEETVGRVLDSRPAGLG